MLFRAVYAVPEVYQWYVYCVAILRTKRSGKQLTKCIEVVVVENNSTMYMRSMRVDRRTSAVFKSGSEFSSRREAVSPNFFSAQMSIANRVTLVEIRFAEMMRDHMTLNKNVEHSRIERGKTRNGKNKDCAFNDY